MKCFEAITSEGKAYLEKLGSFSRSGLVSVISKKSDQNINALALDIWKNCADGNIRMKSAPSKAIFYTTQNGLSDSIVESILFDQAQKKEARVKKFEEFTSGIEAGKTAEQLVREALNL